MACRVLVPFVIAFSALQCAECFRSHRNGGVNPLIVDLSKKGKSGNEKLEKHADKKHLEKDASGSPTNDEIKKIDDAVHKTHSKFFQWPLRLRLLIVGAMLSMPLFIVAISFRATPSTGDLASSIFVKTSIHCSFAFSMGWINCIMLLRYKFFATMMVGNTILMGVAFVCNGGFQTAKEQKWAYEYVELCPAQFDNAGHYALMIFLFLFGTFCHGALYKRYGWSSRTFAPICAVIIIAVEAMEYTSITLDSRLDVYMLSPAFGIIVSISQHCGVGGVPWAATGNMSSTGFNLASVLCTPGSSWASSSRELEKVIVNVCLWVAFVAGICIGTLFHSNRTVIFNALYMHCLLYINGMVFQPQHSPLTEKEHVDHPNKKQDGCVFPPAAQANGSIKVET